MSEELLLNTTIATEPLVFLNAEMSTPLLELVA